jgi:hypothetical protein
MVQSTDTAPHPVERAKATGVSADTIRHYERIGVLQKAQRAASGYRANGAIERSEVPVARS